MVLVAVAALTATLLAGLMVGMAATAAFYSFGKVRDSEREIRSVEQEAADERRQLRADMERLHQAQREYWDSAHARMTEIKLKVEALEAGRKP